jgi:hypothetical protein
MDGMGNVATTTATFEANEAELRSARARGPVRDADHCTLTSIQLQPLGDSVRVATSFTQYIYPPQP